MSIADSLLALQTAKTDIATAISDKGVIVPDGTGFSGFASLIDSIESGDSSLLDALIDKDITEVTSNVITVGTYAFYNCTSLTKADFPNATTINNYAFYNCTALSSINFPNLIIATSYAFQKTGVISADFPNATDIGSYVFHSCTNLTSINIPNVNTVGSYAFYGCTRLTEAVLPGATVLGTYAFRNCTKLTRVDLHKVMSIGAYTFNGCSSLETLILRKTDAITTLSATTAILNTPIKSGTGYIYVPSDLLSTYQSATYWSTYSVRFRAIEDYPDICGVAA